MESRALDKYEFKIKAEQIERLVERKDYKMAAKIADGIDWRRVRNVELLMKVSEIYERLERLEDCYEILNMAYDRAPIGRTIVYKMAEMAIRMGDYDEAVELYKEFVKIAPHDLSRYVLKYKINKAKGASLSDLIAILEEFKSREYHEKWAYELALLYYQEGMNAKCVEECDDLVLWFSEGEYVRRALELKMRIQSLTASQEEKYRTLMRMSGSLEVAEEALAKAMEERGETPDQEPEETVDSEVEKEPEELWQEEEEREAAPDSVEDEIKVRTVNPEERYNTINLQAELAAGLKELWKEEEEPDETEAEEPQQAPVQTPVTVSYVPKQPVVATVPVKTTIPPKTASSFKEVNSMRLGEREDGQLTFDESENIIERQITGQMTIADILAEWELKKKLMEGRIARAAEDERIRREEAEALRLQQEKEAEAIRLQQEKEAEEIRLRKKLEEAERQRRLEEEAAAAAANIPDILDILLQPEEVIEEVTEEVTEEPAEEEIVREESVPQEEEFPTIETEVEDDLPQELDEIEAILMAALEEDRVEAEASAMKAQGEVSVVEEPVTEETTKPEQEMAPEVPAEPEVAPQKEKTGRTSKKNEPASNMIQDLERMLENELKHVTGQRLTEEQEQLFAYFTAVHGMNQQLSDFLEEEELREKDGTSVTGNLVVTGESGTGKTTLAIDLVKAVQKQRQMKGVKMAKITGEDLSQKDVAEVVRKLHGGALVIERAGGLTSEAAAKLSGALLGQTGNLFVILEDEPAEIQRLFVRSESLAAKFQRTIEIPVFTNNELVAFGKSYAGEQGYVLDEMAVLALYNRIGNNQTSDHLVNVAEVKEIIDEAVLHASKKGLGKLFAKRRQDEFGNYILLEKDFED